MGARKNGSMGIWENGSMGYGRMAVLGMRNESSMRYGRLTVWGIEIMGYERLKVQGLTIIRVWRFASMGIWRIDSMDEWDIVYELIRPAGLGEAALLTVFLPRSHSRTSQIWSTRLEHPLWLQRVRSPNLRTPAADVHQRIRLNSV